MPEPSKETCPACNGRGWLFCNTGNDPSPRYEIQRCDACARYDGDPAALQAVVNAAQAQPELLRFVEGVGSLQHEPDDDGNPFECASEDLIATLNLRILEARQLLGTAERCVECGEFVPYIIGRPDGAELCRDCFEAAKH